MIQMLWKLTDFLLYTVKFDKQSRAQRTSAERKHFYPKNATTIATDKSECVLVILTYNPALRSISSIIRKHFSILISSDRYRNIFKSVPIVAFRRSNNLTNFLVRAKLRNPLQNIPSRSSFQWGSHFSTCTYISNGLTSSTFPSTGETRPFTHHITIPATLKTLFT